MAKLHDLTPEQQAAKRAYWAAYYAKNQAKIKARAAAWERDNPERVRERRKLWVSKNREHIDAYQRQRYEANKEAIKAKTKAYAIANKERVKVAHRRRHLERMATDPNFRLRVVLRSACHRMICKGWKKTCKTADMLGCDWQTVREHLEKQFQPGMTWQNHSKDGWHIDHIKPLCVFDLTDHEQAKAAFHYTNLQPLWAKDNLRKYDDGKRDVLQRKHRCSIALAKSA